MSDFSTIIMAGGRGERLYPLTRKRAKPAIRFGGTYRIIDFTLSNCMNSGIRKIYLLTQYASTSLERHIRHGWAHYFRTDFEEFIETRPPQQLDNREWYEGTADSVYKNIEMLKDENAGGILILSGDHIYKMDYRKMIDFHRLNAAALTIACVDFPVEKAKDLGVLQIDENNRVISFMEKPESPSNIPGDQTKSMCNIGVYFFDADVLFEALESDKEDTGSAHDFGKNIIPLLLNKGFKVMSYLFWDENLKESKYWRDIGTIDAYYKANMDLVEIEPLFNLYDKHWPIKSYIPQLPPGKTVFNWVNENRIGMAIDSLVSVGVIISGGRVERSILSPGVRINSHANVSNSIIFDDVAIGRGALVNNAILDEGVVIESGDRIGFDFEADSERSYISEGGIRVVTSIK